jgi:hypothetical protein
LWLHKGAFMTVLGFTAGGSLIFYTFTTYMQKYLVNTAGMHAKTASNVMTAALFVYMVMQPAFGACRTVSAAVVRCCSSVSSRPSAPCRCCTR